MDLGQRVLGPPRAEQRLLRDAIAVVRGAQHPVTVNPDGPGQRPEPAEVVGPLAAALHEVDVGVVERDAELVGTFAPPLFLSDSFNTRANAASRVACMSTQGLKVMFVAGFGPIVEDAASARELYLNTLGLPLEAMPHDPAYLHSETLPGVKHFALWPLSSAAESCFGQKEWPASMPKPRSWLEMDVEDATAASAALKAKGYELLVDNREEPWGQTVTRLLSPEGILVGLTITPWLRGEPAKVVQTIDKP